LITEHAVITAERGSRLVQAHNTLDRSPSKPGAPPQAALQGFENDLERLENALDLPPLARQFSESGARQCADFVTCTRRVLECREAAERVTETGWDRVCERLIASPNPLRWSLRSIRGWIGLRRN
jgi:hypothetical protein